MFNHLPSAQRPALPAAGENQLMKRENAIVQNQLKKRADFQPSGARFVGRILSSGFFCTHDFTTL